MREKLVHDHRIGRGHCYGTAACASKGLGINCLNESEYSDTTPCLTWVLLYEDRRFIWVCEADARSLLIMFLLVRSPRIPIMMSNLYPFLMDEATLKHEKIDRLPEVQEPENHLLMVHYDFFKVLPGVSAARGPCGRRCVPSWTRMCTPWTPTCR